MTALVALEHREGALEFLGVRGLDRALHRRELERDELGELGQAIANRLVLVAEVEQLALQRADRLDGSLEGLEVERLSREQVTALGRFRLDERLFELQQLRPEREAMADARLRAHECTVRQLGHGEDHDGNDGGYQQG